MGMKNEMKKLVSGALCLVLGALCLVLGAGSALAATVMFKGETITYENATTCTGGGNDPVVLTFKDTSATGSITVPYDATATILAVGGGGAGGTGNTANNSGYRGVGGNGGEVVENSYTLAGGSKLTISVGAGGARSTSANSSGGNGKDSTVKSSSSDFADIVAGGGTGGTANNTSGGVGQPTVGTTSVIDGNVYGKGGANYGTDAAVSGADNTGDGGQGGRRSSTSSQNYGGNGGSGVVIVKITSVQRPIEPVVTTFEMDVGSYTNFTCTSEVSGGWGVTSSNAFAAAGTITEENGKTCKLVIRAYCTGDVDDEKRECDSEITVRNEGAVYVYRVRVDPVIKDRSKWIKMPLKAADGKFHYIAYEGAEVKTNGMSIVFTFTNNTFGAAKADAYADGRQSVPGRLELPAPFAYRANVLAVGGGGAGGTQSRKTFGGGGGGAGGYMEKWNEAIDPGVLYVEVGTGAPAASGAVTADKGLNGGLSIVTNSLGAVIVSALGGGGGGGGRLGEDGQPGGSGGGGAWIDSASSTKGGVSQAGTGMDGQGNVGGTPMPVEKGGAGYPNAAGGGGAAQTTNETTYVSWGAGLATGEGGLGRTNDITGVAREYAHGGRGGNESLPRGRGADGADGLGNGGDGGNGDCGGAGGNGVVVIAITYAYENVHIQPPKIGVESGPTNRTTLLRGDLGLRTEYYDNGISEFCWTNNSTETYVSFNTNAFVRNGQGGYVYDAGDEKKKLTFGDIVKYWDGTSETNVVVETDAKTGHLVTNNVCHHNFTIYLKDGYVWYDGTAYGSSKGHYVDWRITESFNTVDATIGVKKIVDWLPDGSNATITVTTHSTPAMYKRVPNVLFLGTRCGNHDLTAQVVTESIKSISSKGNVDWFLFGSTGTGSGEGLWRHGSVPQGGATPTFTDSTSLTGGDIVKISNGPHKSLKLFYSYFDAIFYGNKDTYVKEDAEEDFYKGTNHYDYVIIETDGSRVAHGYTGRDAEQEKRVAEALLKYYANSNVIWIVDNGVDYKEYFNYCSGKSGFSNYTDIFEYGDAYGKKYRVNNGFLRKNGDAGQYMNFCEGETSTSSTTNHDTWKALLGIFDPALYLSGELYYGEQGTSDEGMKTRNALTTTNQAQSQNQIFYAGHPYEENQAFYDNVESVTHLLDQVIKPEIYDFKGGDQVLESKGLTLTHVDFYWTDKDPYQSVPEAWGPRRTYWDAKEHPQDYKNNLIEVHAATNYVITTVTNVDYELWAKMDIGIIDDGTFKTSVNAVFNPTTGQYEKNPNNGEAKASMKSHGSEKEVKGSATTSAAWKYFAYKVGGAVENGEIFLNGLTGYRSIAFCEGYSPTVSYRGKPGYMINELWIDSNLVEDPKGDVESFATFAKIARDHDVIVSYTNFVTGIASAPTNYVYDGQAHVFPVFVDTVENPPYRTEVRYALEEDSTNYLPAAEFCATNCAALKDKGEYKFYFKVYSYQPGYGESFTNGWGEIKEIDLGDVKIVGHGQNTVTITPAPLTITAGSTTNIEIQVAQQTVNALIDEMAKSTNVICKGFVNGEGMEALDFSDLKMTCATYDPDSSRPGQYDIDITEGSVTALKGNYAITLKPGKLNVGKSAFEVSGIRQTGDGETGVDDAVKVYDGEPTNISVNVTFPLLPEQYTIKYRIGEDGVWTNGIGEAHLPGFSFTDVVETNVWYALESDFCFPATNCAKVIITPRPVTLQSASATHPYNGKTLMTNLVWVVDKDVRDYGWAPGEGLKEKDGYTCQGALAAVGTMANTFLYTLRDNTKATNYDITITNGLLTVTRAPMVIGDPNDPAKQVTYPTSEAREDWPEVNGVQDVYTTYDGKGTNILVNVIDPSSVLERKIWYSTNQVDWAQNLLLTNVYNGPMYFKVEDTNHNYYTAMNVAYLVISQRVATVTAAGASKVYDGTALATDDFTTDNFVKGEGIASVEMTADSSIVNASTTNNVIDKSSVEPLEGTLLSNYKLEFKDGTLEVTKRPLTLKSPDKSAKWECDPVTFLASEIEDVSEGENSGYVDDEELKYTVTGKQSTPGSSNASFKWSDSDDGKTLVSNYDVAHVFGTLTIGEGAIEIRRQKQPQSGDDPTPAPGSEESGVNPVEVFYDGLGHSIEVDVTYPMDYTIQYREDKSDVWSDVNPAYTNVCTSNVVWYSVNADGYYPVTNCAWVTVKPRPITVTANDQEMTYGEDMPDLAGEFTIDDPVDSKVGDVFTVPLAYTNDTTVTVNAGTYPEAVMTNAAIVVSNDTADVTECYDITFVPGKLTVNKAKMSVTVTDVETTYEYKSKGTNISVSVTSPTEVPTRIEYSLDGGLTWTNELALTEAGTYPVTFRVTDGDNYATLTSNGTVKINRRYITVTADDKEISVEESKRLTGEYLDKFVTYKVTVDGTTPLETLPDGEVAKLRINVGIHALLGEPGEYRHTERDEDGQPWGTTVGGDMEQGNYILAFRGGDLVIFNRQRIGYESMDVVVPYDGEGHGIREVVVTNPAAWKPGDDYEVAYSRYDLDTRTYFDWQDSPIAAITNVTEWGGAVMGFAITPVGPDADKYQAVTNTATVTVTQRVVTVTATNAWKYVDTPDPAFGATVKGLIEKEQARAGELIKYSVSRTNDTEAVGVYTNVIVASGSADQGNYSVVYKPADFEIKEPKEKPMPLKPLEPVEVFYDGKGHMFEPQFDWKNGKVPEDLTITYSATKVGEYVERLEATNVVETGTYWFKATAEGYYETNDCATVTIKKRTVQLKSQSGSWEYDGKGHGTNEVFEVTAYDGPGGNGFVPKEGVTTNVTGSVTNVADTATGNNTFTYKLTEKTLEGNYTIKNPVYGDLAITPRKVTPKKPSKDPTAGDPIPPENPEENPEGGDTPTIWAQNIVKCYDGIGTNIIAKIYNVKPEDEEKFTYKYSTDEHTGFVDWKDLQFTNVVTGLKVYYRAVAQNGANYLGTNCYAYVTITQRVASAGIVANDAEMTYGKPKSRTPIGEVGYTGPGEGELADGDGIRSVSLMYTNEVQAVLEKLPANDEGYAGWVSTNGAVRAAIVITNATGDVTANYRMAFTPGALKVTRNRAKVDEIADSDDRFYTGEGWEPLKPEMVTAKNDDGKGVQIPASEYYVKYYNNTNATVNKEAYVVVTFTNNYSDVITNHFSIKKRVVTLKADSAKKAYDATALTTNGYTVVEGVDGTTNFVALAGKPAEGLTNATLTVMTAASTRTAVGKTDNVIDEDEIAFNDYTLASNYTLKFEKGALEVEAAPVETPVPPAKPDDPVSGPPEAGGEPTLWATNVVMTYNGTGTNISALVYNAKEGNAFTYDYSTNGTAWFRDDDHNTFTNVGTYQVWYRAKPETGCNYLGTNCWAWVTILPKESPLNVRIVPVDEFPWNGETDWYHVATNGLIVTDADGKTLEMGTDYACVEVEAVDITNALLKVRGIGNYEGSAGQTNFWVSGYKVSVWIEDACQGTNFCGALSGTEAGTNVVLEGYAIDLPHSVTNGTVVKVDRMASEDILHLVARLATDSNGDGVPDKYQRMLTFRVINGYWTDEDDKAIDSAPRTVWITKFNADGKWDVNGSNTLAAADIPCVGQRPIGNNFAKGGKWWTGASDVLTDTLVGLTVDNAISPLFIFGYNHAPAGGSRRTGGGQPLDPVFRTTVKIADFAYADGKATFGPRVDVMEGDALVVSMPMEDSMVTIKGKKTLEDQDWTAIGEFRTNGHGYVIIETGDYKFFTIETK